jgi:hypothetical protein
MPPARGICLFTRWFVILNRVEKLSPMQLLALFEFGCYVLGRVENRLDTCYPFGKLYPKVASINQGLGLKTIIISLHTIYNRHNYNNRLIYWRSDHLN